MPLKGKIKSLKPLESYGENSDPIIAKTFSIYNLTTGGKYNDKKKIIIKKNIISQGLYLDSLEMHSEPTILKNLIKNKDLTIYGNRLDHKSKDDLINDYLNCLFKESILFIFLNLRKFEK